MYPAYGSRGGQTDANAAQSKYLYDTNIPPYIPDTTYFDYTTASSSHAPYGQINQYDPASSSQAPNAYETNVANYASEHYSSAYSPNISYNHQSPSNHQYPPSYTNPIYTTAVGSTQESSTKKKVQKHDWVKRDSLRQAAPYSGGNGMRLLQKMGWCPGEGLGKRKDGSLEPHLPYIKVNKRGLDVSKTEKFFRKQSGNLRSKPAMRSIVTDGKHPISILAEYCSKQKWDPPIYQAIVDEGPIHAKNYVFKVIVNGTEYKAQTGSNIKKNAKSEAALVCLRTHKIMKE